MASREIISKKAPDYKQLMRKKISKVIFLLMFGPLIFAGILGGRYLLIHFPDFKIKEISIVTLKGQAVSNPQEFFRLDSDNEFNLFNFNMKRIVQDIQARHPELANVYIRKQFPHKLLIMLEEREPVAIIALREFYLVDAEAFILPFKSIYRNLPNFIGIHPKQIQLYARSNSLRLKKALELLKELKEAKIYPEYKVSQINLRQYSDIVFYLANGVEIKMGQSDFERKSALLSVILARLKVNDTVPKYIDMRFDDPVVKP